MAFLSILCIISCMVLFIHGYATPNNDVCTYTFNVAREGDLCAPGGDNVDPLKTLITNQHELIEQQLDTISQALSRLDGRDGSENANIDNNSGDSSGGGLTYTQWGRKSCPDTATLVYEGFAGKSYFSHGGGVNYLCMPRDPEFPEGARSGHQSNSYVYGVEYERNGSPLVDQALHDNDAPCAVCEVTGRTRLLMIPAKMTCPTGWTQEYDGLLMAQHHTHSSSDYACVARDMEVLHGGSGGTDGGLFYVVEAVCGALKCPPYIDGYEIACAVCTK